MPEPTAEDTATRFERDSEKPDKPAPSKPRARKKTEVLVDATKLLDRLFEVTSEAERAAVRLEGEQSQRESLEAAVNEERALREKAERALAQAKSAEARLSTDLDAERTAREQAEKALVGVEEKAATLEHQVNLTWNQLKVSEEEQHGPQGRRWWRGDS